MKIYPCSLIGVVRVVRVVRAVGVADLLLRVGENQSCREKTSNDDDGNDSRDSSEILRMTLRGTAPRVFPARCIEPKNVSRRMEFPDFVIPTLACTIRLPSPFERLSSYKCHLPWKTEEPWTAEDTRDHAEGKICSMDHRLPRRFRTRLPKRQKQHASLQTLAYSSHRPSTRA